MFLSLHWWNNIVISPKKKLYFYLYSRTQPPFNNTAPLQIFLNIIIIKKYWQCKAGRGRLTPYQSEDPSPTLPTYRGEEEKGKIVEDKKLESN